MGKNNFDIRGMRVELFLPSEHVSREVIFPRLSHGSNIIAVQSGDESMEDCDALVTENRVLSLGIKTADCAPICFSDDKKIGIAHIGWRGLCLGLIEKMITNFDVASLAVYVAPFLNSFEIKKDFCYEKITEKFGEPYIEHQSDKLLFNFKAAISSLLPRQTIFDPRNAGTDDLFPSYRRNKTSDRFATVIAFP